jgi:ubiquinone/menaquinone biosynthesis C-methylase UbiE
MAEFDKFSSRYSDVNNAMTKNLSGFDLNYFNEYKIRDLYSEVGKITSNLKIEILDFGCGVGNSAPFLREYFQTANIQGVDVSEESIKIANSLKSNQTVHFQKIFSSLPFANDSFDLIFSACVFHHIPINERSYWIKELYRCLKPGGVLMIYEHNPMNPITQIIFRTAEFDKGAHMLYSSKLNQLLKEANFKSIKSKYRVFFPKLLSRFLFLELFLSKIPLGAQYYSICRK